MGNPIREVFATERFEWRSPLEPTAVQHAMSDLGLGLRHKGKPLRGALRADRFVARKRVAVQLSGLTPELRADYGRADDGVGSRLRCRLGPPVTQVATRLLFPPLLVAIVVGYVGTKALLIGGPALVVLLLTYLTTCRHRGFILSSTLGS